MQLSLYQTEDAGVSKVDPGVRDYIRQRMQETISHSGCKRLYQTAETGVLYQTADARDSIRQQMQQTISDRMQESLK